LDLFDGPLAITFTAGEAAWLAGQLSERQRTRPTAAEAVAERRAVVGAIGLIELFDREIRDRQAEDSELRSGSRRAALTASVNPADLGRMTTFKHTAGRVGDLLYAVLFGMFVSLGVWLAGDELVEATNANSATWTWEPIVLGVGVVTGIAAARAVRSRQRSRPAEPADRSDSAAAGSRADLDEQGGTGEEVLRA
jgi:hypothetical protein